MSKIDTIIEAVNAGVDTFRQETYALPGQDIYMMAYRINIIEEIAFLICENEDMWEDEDEVVAVLASLVERGRFMLELEAWVTDLDAVDVSDLSHTMDSLCEFCEWVAEREVDDPTN